jgi:hypothetical protein
LNGEDGFVEVSTALLAIVGGCYGIGFVRRLRRQQVPRYVPTFFALFSCGLLLVGFEEISWGQHLFGFETPDFYRTLNAQGELNLHNIKGWSGTNSVLRIAFGVGGLTGIRLAAHPLFLPLAPARLFLGWFAVITTLGLSEGTLDLLDARGTDVTAFVANSLAEVNEMLVAGAGALYLLLQNRRLAVSGFGSSPMTTGNH